MLEKYGVPEQFINAIPKLATQLHPYDAKLKEWLNNPRGFMIMSGLYGVGKTYCAAACLAYLLHKGEDSMRFFNCGDLYLRWKADVREGNDAHLLWMCCDYKFLVLDDLGQRSPSEAWIEFLYLLFDKRRVEGKGTIVTTNLTSKEFVDCFGGAIASRMQGGLAIRIEGSDRRRGVV